MACQLVAIGGPLQRLLARAIENWLADGAYKWSAWNMATLLRTVVEFISQASAVDEHVLQYERVWAAREEFTRSALMHRLFSETVCNPLMSTTDCTSPGISQVCLLAVRICLSQEVWDADVFAKSITHSLCFDARVAAAHAMRSRILGGSAVPLETLLLALDTIVIEHHPDVQGPLVEAITVALPKVLDNDVANNRISSCCSTLLESGNCPSKFIILLSAPVIHLYETLKKRWIELVVDCADFSQTDDFRLAAIESLQLADRGLVCESPTLLNVLLTLLQDEYDDVRTGAARVVMSRMVMPLGNETVQDVSWPGAHLQLLTSEVALRSGLVVECLKQTLMTSPSGCQQLSQRQILYPTESANPFRESILDVKAAALALAQATVDKAQQEELRGLAHAALESAISEASSAYPSIPLFGLNGISYNRICAGLAVLLALDGTAEMWLTRLQDIGLLHPTWYDARSSTATETPKGEKIRLLLPF
jgi:hypothetical protein